MTQNSDSHTIKPARGRAVSLTRNLRSGLSGLGALILLPVFAAAQVPNLRNASSNQSLAGSAVIEPQTAPEPSTPKPPHVTYQDTQLTINAENSRLSDVLSAVRDCTAADLDIPASASEERVWVSIGPAPARKVLAQLLDGTHLDYVIQASDSDPDEVRSIMLSTRLKPGAGTSVNERPQVTASRIPKPNQPAQEFPVPENPVSAVDASPAAIAQSAPPINTAATPSSGVIASDTPSTVTDAASRPAPSTTDQMIQKLESMYEQRKQMQSMGSPSKPPGTN